MGNSASSLPEHVGGQVQRAAERLQRKVRGKKPVRVVRGDDHGAAPSFAGGRRLAVFCDGCGEIIRPGQRFMPVRGCQDPANDRDLCAACTEAYNPGNAETQFAMSNPIALAEPWRPSMETMYHTPDTEALLSDDSLRVGVLRCLAAYHDRPLLGIVERRRGRGSLAGAERGGGKEKNRSKVQFATYAQLHRRYTYV